jgi:hypothetical protein
VSGDVAACLEYVQSQFHCFIYVISINVGVHTLHDDLIMSGAWATALQAVTGSIPDGVIGIFH